MSATPQFSTRVKARMAPLFAAALALAALGFAARGAAADAAPAADLHTFTNDGGASFKAQITGVTADEVTLKREDGQVFRPKVALFSKADQSYIWLWAAKNAAAHGAGVFNFHPVPIKGIVTSNADAATHATISTWKENYNLDVKNLTTVTWPSLHFRYIIIKQSANPGNVAPEDFSLQRVTGLVDVDKFSAGEQKTIPLEKVDMRESRLNGNISYTNGAPKVATDKFMGIWIRVYDDDENLLQEWASNPEILKTERWTFPKSGAARGAAATVPTPHTPAPPSP